MTNIEVGDTVIYGNGDVCDVTAIHDNGGRKRISYEGDSSGQCDLSCVNVVKTGSPLRVKIEHEADVRALVERAEEAGYDAGKDLTKKVNSSTLVGLTMYPSNKGMDGVIIWSNTGYDAQYPSDADQVIAWLEYHQDEDEQQQWDHPAPGDPEWREAAIEWAKGEAEELGDSGASRLGLNEPIDAIVIADLLLDHIDRLEERLEEGHDVEYHPPEIECSLSQQELEEAAEAVMEEYDELYRRLADDGDEGVCRWEVKRSGSFRLIDIACKDEDSESLITENEPDKCRNCGREIEIVHEEE